MVKLTDREARPLGRLVEYLHGDRFNCDWFYAHPKAEPLLEGQFEADMRILGAKVDGALASARRDRETSPDSEVEDESWPNRLG